MRGLYEIKLQSGVLLYKNINLMNKVNYMRLSIKIFINCYRVLI
jgi:hypothetical protein